MQGFPTIKLFKNGNAPQEYDGGRTEAEIVNWVSKKSGPAAVTLSSLDDLTNMEEKHASFAVGIFSDVEGEAAKAYLKVADANDNHIFTITSSSSIKEKLGVTTDNTIVVIKTFDELRNDLVIDASNVKEEEIEDFISASCTPLIQTFTDETSKQIFSSAIKVHNLFFTHAEAVHHTLAMDVMKEVASKFRGKMLFVNVPSTQTRIIEYFGKPHWFLLSFLTLYMGDSLPSSFPSFFLILSVFSSFLTAFLFSFKVCRLSRSLRL